ncbi:MAG: PEGA domain-containing protein [Candidatus Sulfotelmatobacter sp.]
MKSLLTVAALAALSLSSFAQRKSPDSPPEKAKIHVTSTPDGGEVYVDGKFRGNTPSDILLSPREHIVRVVLRQKEWTRTVEITGGEINIRADLVDEKSGA